MTKRWGEATTTRVLADTTQARAYHAVAGAGNITTLASLMHVTVHMTNIKIKMCGINGTAANGNSRYFDVVGPWPHDGHSTQ